MPTPPHRPRPVPARRGMRSPWQPFAEPTDRLIRRYRWGALNLRDGRRITGGWAITERAARRRATARKRQLDAVWFAQLAGLTRRDPDELRGTDR